MSQKKFSFIWANENHDYEKSSGEAFEILESDFALELTDENKRTLNNFVNSAEVDEAIFIEGTLVLREADDFEADCDVVVIPSAEFPVELKAVMRLSPLLGNINHFQQVGMHGF